MSVLTWLAHSPIASFFKVFSAGVLGWVLMNSESLGFHPAVALGLAAALPIVINWLNPEYDNYGRANLDVAD
jgi:hypothetical protein